MTAVIDFRPCGAAMARLSKHGGTTSERDDGSEIDMTRAIDLWCRVDTVFKVVPGLYQAITGSQQERQKTYRQCSPGFFDPIVIDECHRGSLNRWITQPRREPPDRSSRIYQLVREAL